MLTFVKNNKKTYDYEKDNLSLPCYGFSLYRLGLHLM